MICLNERQTEKMKLWLQIKPWVIAIGFLLILFENLTGVRTFLGVLPGYIALIVVLVIGLIMRQSLKRRKMWLILAHASFIIDASVILAGIYFHGGLETPWAFGPVFVTFMGAYVFGTAVGIVYATYTFSMFLGMFLLEYYRIIPHFSIFNLPDLYWIDEGYFADSLLGIFMLNFVMAIAVGAVSRVTDQRSEKIEEYVRELEESYSRVRAVEVEAEQAAKLVEEKNAELKRNRKIIKDREQEITEVERDIERLKKEKKT